MVLLRRLKKKKAKKILKEKKNCSNLEWNVQNETYLEVPSLGNRLETTSVSRKIEMQERNSGFVIRGKRSILVFTSEFLIFHNIPQSIIYQAAINVAGELRRFWLERQIWRLCVQRCYLKGHLLDCSGHLNVKIEKTLWIVHSQYFLKPWNHLDFSLT